MRGKLILSLVVVLSLTIAASANALDSDQKSVILTIEQGKTVRFFIYMSGGGSAEITHTGDINKWVSHPDSISSEEWLEVKVEVPGDADLKSYKENILADGDTVTKVTVIVTGPVTGKLSTIQKKIETLISEQDDLEDYIHDKIGENNAKISHLETAMSDMTDDVNEMTNIQKDVSETESRFSADKEILQQMIAKLESDLSDMEQENKQLNDMTGMLTVNWSSAGFAFGVIVVLAAILLYFKGKPKLASFGVSGITKRFSGSSRTSGTRSKPIQNREKELAEVRSDSSVRAEKTKTHERIRGPEDFSYSYRPK